MLKRCSAPYYNFDSGTLMDEKRIFWDTLENENGHPWTTFFLPRELKENSNENFEKIFNI